MTRPSFHAAWAAANRIYDPSNSSVRVANVIGGMVKRNILHPDPKQRWENTCAVRISYVLNQTGARIPFVKKETVSGADGSWYFYRIERVLDYLKVRWGRPEVVAHPPSHGGALAGQQGLLVFEISGWTDGQGTRHLMGRHPLLRQVLLQQRRRDLSDRPRQLLAPAIAG